MAGKIKIEYDENDIKRLIAEDIELTMNIKVDLKEVSFLVRSKQNYREKEWERGEFRATFESSRG